MLDNSFLSKEAMRQCLAHAQRRVVGDVIVSANKELVDWDGFQMTHVYTQSMTVWRRFGRIDIIVDSGGNLVGFIDHEKYRNPGDGILERDVAESLIREAGVVPVSAILEEYLSIKPPSGEGRIWKAVFALAFPLKDYELLDVEINPTGPAIIAVRPKRRGGAHG
jgi:hypothetical protein